MPSSSSSWWRRSPWRSRCTAATRAGSSTARARTRRCGCCAGRSACCPRSGPSGARPCSANSPTSTAAGADALRPRLHRRRPDHAALGPGRRRPLGDDRDHRGQPHHLHRHDRPLRARRRRLDRARGRPAHLRRVPARRQRAAAPTRHRAARPARRPVRDPGRTRVVRVHRVDLVTYIPRRWHQRVTVLAVPAVIGAAGTLWRRDPAAGRRVARLAALSAGLLQLLYATVAVAILGGGGPPDQDGGFTVRGTVSDRLGNNLFLLGFTILVFATIGWGGAAAAGRLLRRTPTATGPVTSNPVPPQRVTPMTIPNNETDPGIRVPRGRRAVRIVVMCVVVAAILFLAAISWSTMVPNGQMEDSLRPNGRRESANPANHSRAPGVSEGRAPPPPCSLIRPRGRRSQWLLGCKR